MVRGLDHVALVVPDTGNALALWRDRLGFSVLLSEVVNGGTVRLTHLDLGGARLQLVEPLTKEHPLRAWLAQHGPGLHHLCFKVDDVGRAAQQARELGLLKEETAPHQGTRGQRALFFDVAATQGVTVEITGP